MVKNPILPMQEMQVPSLGWEDPLEEEMATDSSILAWRIPMNREAWGAQSRGCKELDTTEDPHTASCGFFFFFFSCMHIGS